MIIKCPKCKESQEIVNVACLTCGEEFTLTPKNIEEI